MSSRSIVRALLLAVPGLASSACLLAVSTSGLAGDPLDAAPETSSDGSADGASDTSVIAVDAGADVRDAFTPPDGSTTWSGNGHAYEVVVISSGVSWTEARDLATRMGGHLVTIGDANENSFVLDLAQAHPEAFRANGTGPWLGAQQMTDDAGEPAAGWRWLDGTPWLYTYWATGQPDNSAGIENYLDLYAPSGVLGWNDDALDGTQPRNISLLVEFE